MRIARTLCVSGLALLVAACGGDGASADWPRSIAGCTLEETEAIGGDDAPFGFSARDAVAGLPVRDGYPLRHGGGATSTLSVGIESADLGEVVWVKRSYGGSEELRFPCPEALLFRGVVRFRSEDGTYDERLETPILATATDAFTFEATVPVERIAGRLDTGSSEPKAQTVTIGGLVEGDEASGLVSTSGKTRTELVFSHIGWWGAAAP